MENIRRIISLFKEEVSEKSTALYFVPRFNFNYCQILEPAGVLSKISSIGKCDLCIVPLAEDLLSLEMPKALKKMHIDQCPKVPFALASAVKHIVQLYGGIPHMQAIGESAKRVLELTRHLFGSSVADSQGAIARLTLVDHRVDFITPCLLPSAFEGLADELVGIKVNVAKVEGLPILLEETSSLYAKLSRAHIDNVQSLFTQEIGNIENAYKLERENFKFKKMSLKTVDELKLTVEPLNLKSAM